MKIYLAGPMTGYPKQNYPLFDAVAGQLRGAGHIVYSPAEFRGGIDLQPFPIREAFIEYLTFICDQAEAIVLLPGWQDSVGATAELAMAKVCKIHVIEFKDLSLIIPAKE